MPKDLKNNKIAIIGAGMAGISAALKLQDKAQVTLFDKSRGIGGRMATRRTEKYNFDHGAQFFTAKSEEFQVLCQQAQKDGVIELWNADFVEITAAEVTNSRKFSAEYPHYVATPQMNSLCKYLAQDFNVNLGQKITKIDFKDKKWTLQNDQDEKFEDFDYLIVAIPSHQVLDLINESTKDCQRIKEVKMLGCFALMVGLKEDPKLDFQAALIKESIISWISVNSSKPQRAGGATILVNSRNSWAEENMERDIEEVKELLLEDLVDITKIDREIIDHVGIQRWRYANIGKQKGDSFIFDEKQALGICGDWLIHGRVEAAYQSGGDVAEKILPLL